VLLHSSGGGDTWKWSSGGMVIRMGKSKEPPSVLFRRTRISLDVIRD
jgi:hypothetical protein